jgi:hypothetical protein
VKDHHLGKVAAAKTAKELWDDLETTYKCKSNARKMLLRREINTLKLGSGEPISMYVARAEDLYKNLTAAGSDMKPEELAFAILAGLPDEYGTLVTILEATSEKMSAKEMLPLLLQMEARLKLQGSSERGESQATAYAAKRLSSKKGFAYKKGKLGKLGELGRGLGKLGELLPVWGSSQVDGVQGLQADRVPKLWEERVHAGGVLAEAREANGGKVWGQREARRRRERGSFHRSRRNTGRGVDLGFGVHAASNRGQGDVQEPRSDGK